MKARQKVIAIFSALAVCACAIVGLCLWQPWVSNDNDNDADDSTLSWDTFDGTEDEYLDAVANEMSSGHVELNDYEIVYPEDGSTPYRKQLVVIFFYRSYGEERAREIVADMGGEWMEDYFGINPDEETAFVTARFPEDADVVAISDEFEAMEEVDHSGPEWVIDIDLD